MPTTTITPISETIFEVKIYTVDPDLAVLADEAAASAATATNSANIAGAAASDAEEAKDLAVAAATSAGNSASSASTSADTATTQAGIATTKAEEAANSVNEIETGGYAKKSDVSYAVESTNNVTGQNINLFNKQETQSGYRTNLGVFVSNLSILVTGFIPVIAGQNYTIGELRSLGAQSSQGRFCFFNSSKVFHSAITLAEAAISTTITSPINGFLTVNIGSLTNVGLGDLTNNVLVNSFQVEKGSVKSPYMPFGYYIKGNKIKDFEIQISVNSDFNIIGSGSVYRSDNGQITDIAGVGSPYAGRSDGLISVNPNEIYEYTGQVGGNIGISGYNELKVFNSRILDNSNIALYGTSATDIYTSLRITIPAGVFYIGLSTKNNVTNPLKLVKITTGEINKVLSDSFNETQEYPKKTKIKIEGISANKFNVSSLAENGTYIVHTFEKRTMTSPQKEDGWYASDIRHNGNLIMQGNFNWIHQTNLPNENAFVGVAHGCEVFIDTRWFLDGLSFNPASIIGQTLEGSEFSFQWVSEIYVVDAASTVLGYEAVAKVPLEKSTRHHLSGWIKGFNDIGFRNKLIFLRDGVNFSSCYPMMMAGYTPYFKFMQIENIENTVNLAIPSSQTAVSPSTAVINTQTYNTSDGKRAELAFCAHMWSDEHNYKATNIMYNLVNTDQSKFSIQSASGPNGTAARNKLYFQPVITSQIASARGLTADTFNTGDFIEVECFRKITL